MGLFDRWRKTPADPEEPPLEHGRRDADLMTLQHLRDAGARLDEPRHVLHFLYLTGAAQAESARVRAAASGWQAEVRDPLPDHPEQWTLVCERQAAVLSLGFVRESTDFFEALADDLGGRYDGWEASIRHRK